MLRPCLRLALESLLVYIIGAPHTHMAWRACCAAVCLFQGSTLNVGAPRYHRARAQAAAVGRALRAAMCERIIVVGRRQPRHETRHAGAVGHLAAAAALGSDSADELRETPFHSHDTSGLCCLASPSPDHRRKSEARLNAKSVNGH